MYRGKNKKRGNEKENIHKKTRKHKRTNKQIKKERERGDKASEYERMIGNISTKPELSRARQNSRIF